MTQIDELYSKIHQLEKYARVLELDAQSLRNYADKTIEYAHDFLESLSHKPAYQTALESDASIRDYNISEEATDLNGLLNAIKKYIDYPGINPASPGHLGYIPGGGLYPSALADYLAAVSNRYAGIFFAAPGAVRLENMLIEWMCKLMGFPTTATGNLTSGGSISNLIAVVTARDAANISAQDYNKLVIYLSGETHHALHKALRIAGLGESIIRQVPYDQAYAMDPHELQDFINEDLSNDLIPFLVCGTIGTTNTGSVDPISVLANICQEHKIWFHVDAAYGGFFKLVPSLAHLFKGIEEADSITLDPHKSLFLPFGTGAVLIKNTEAVFQSHHYLGEYMQDMMVNGMEISPADVSPELTKHFRGLRLWLPLKLFGLSTFRAALEEKHHLALLVYERLKKMDCTEVGPEPKLSIAMFRVVLSEKDPTEYNQGLIKAFQKDGRIFLSSTTIDGIFWIRVCVLLFRTHLEQIDLFFEILKQHIQD